MIRINYLGTTLRMFSNEEAARVSATLSRHPLADTRKFQSGWLYQSGDTWHDEDGAIPFKTSELEPDET